MEMATSYAHAGRCVAWVAVPPAPTFTGKPAPRRCALRNAGQACRVKLTPRASSMPVSEAIPVATQVQCQPPA
jgi:hypothetical protein